jgi:predicted metalloenzyme YecM
MIEILGDYEGFVERINHGLADAGIDRSEIAMIDHICFRVETHKRYQELFTAFAGSAAMIGEVEVAGRQIATFEFDEPLKAGGWRIPYLELPAPKEGSPYAEGLEHAELVVIGDIDKFAIRHNDLIFDRKGMNKTINPELGLKTDKMSVKFHEQPLGAVVRIEQRLAGK